MRAKGITYDTGFVRHGVISRDTFDPDVVKRELEIIHDDLAWEPKAAFSTLAEYYLG